VTQDNGSRADGTSPDELVAELEARLLELEVAGAEVPTEVKHHLERIQRLMAAGQAEGVQFMQAGDQKSGVMGCSVPLESGNSEDDPEKGAT
jgi:hypothetical protein